MATPVVPNQFTVEKNKIVHKPTRATFSFDTGNTAFKSVDWDLRMSTYRPAQITEKTT